MRVVLEFVHSRVGLHSAAIGTPRYEARSCVAPYGMAIARSTLGQAEHAAAIIFAVKGKMELALGIAVGSAVQASSDPI